VSELTIIQNQLREVAEVLLGAYPRVIAPVLRAAGAHRPGDTEFASLGSAEEACFAAINTVTSIKECFLPRSEELFLFDQGKGESDLRTHLPDEQPTVLLGARPCDAGSLPLLDRVFLDEPTDEFWASRRRRTTVVTIGCAQADPFCFCTAVGLGPDSPAGSDVLLLPRADGRFAVRPLTDKGQTLVTHLKELLVAAEPAPLLLAEVRQRCGLRPDTACLGGLGPPRFSLAQAQAALADHFDDGPWEALSFPCLGCGVCTYLCPTCYCFDLADEGKVSRGERRKNWDSCSLSLFTQHASGHNPRAELRQRWRHRLEHKFRYFPERYGAVACTGCGRCRRFCPAGLGVEDTLVRIAGAGAEGSEAGALPKV
jgi:ferredoxin